MSTQFSFVSTLWMNKFLRNLKKLSFINTILSCLIISILLSVCIGIIYIIWIQQPDTPQLTVQIEPISDDNYDKFNYVGLIGIGCVFICI